MVSIIVPVYNAEKTIEKCVDSILAQTVEKQIILVNDGSKDGSLEILQRYAHSYEGVIVVDKPNGGVSSARNAALAVSTGEYITFIDSDDYYLTNDYIANMVCAAQREEGIDLVIAGYTLITPTGQKCYDAPDCVVPILQMAEDYLTYRSQNLMNSPWNKLFRRALISTLFDERMKMGEDSVFVLAYLKRCGKVAFCRGCGYGYLFMNTSSTAQFRKKCHFDIAQTNLYHDAIHDFWSAFLPDRACADRYLKLRIEAVHTILTTYLRNKGIFAFLTGDIRQILSDERLNTYKEYIPSLPNDYAYKKMANLIQRGSVIAVKWHCIWDLLKTKLIQLGE